MLSVWNDKDKYKMCVAVVSTSNGELQPHDASFGSSQEEGGSRQVEVVRFCSQSQVDGQVSQLRPQSQSQPGGESQS